MADTHAVPAADTTAMTGTSPPLYVILLSYISPNSCSWLRLPRVNVPLTKEARKVINERCRQAAACYQEDLGNTWEKIDKSIADLAVTHHKSIHCVQKELHMGRSVLHTRRTVNAWNAWCAKVSNEESSHTGKGTSWFVSSEVACIVLIDF
jgi:hypothetical protein